MGNNLEFYYIAFSNWLCTNSKTCFIFWTGNLDKGDFR